MNEKSKRRISLWLYSGCFLIFLMVVIGGITRLTGSGLSITEWNLIMGSIPPMNDAEWQIAFSKYQQIPQFQKINAHFELSDFKSIYWWEFIHRQLGRLIGLVFLIPFLYFLVTRQMDRAIIKKSMFLFFLGGLQGFLGWYMVSSGLVERTSVSHIRLAVHLITAFVTFGFTYWYALEIRSSEDSRAVSKASTGIIRIIFTLLIIQIIYGAFVAGMHAGKMYNTFPLMNGQVIPTGMGTVEPLYLNFINNPVTVQFIHRIFAFVLLFLVAKVWWTSKKNGNESGSTESHEYCIAGCISSVFTRCADTLN